MSMSLDTGSGIALGSLVVILGQFAYKMVFSDKKDPLDAVKKITPECDPTKCNERIEGAVRKILDHRIGKLEERASLLENDRRYISDTLVRIEKKIDEEMRERKDDNNAIRDLVNRLIDNHGSSE